MSQSTGSPAAARPAAAPPIPAGPPVAASGPRELELRFTGSAAEYFRIWIVSVCLTLLTLGIYSAWAKVRKKRYLYSHTVLDGTPFQYLARPIPILKGRIIAAALFVLWYVGTHYVVKLLPVVVALVVVLTPWVLVRSAAFNARYSAFRNLTFHFSGTYWSAARTLYGWALITVLTLGFGFAWWQQRIKRYMVSHMNYGGIGAEFSARGGQFFVIYLLAGLLFAAGMTAAVMLFGVTVAAAVGTAQGEAAAPLLIAFVLGIYAVYVAAFAYLQARITNLVWNHTRLGPLKFESRLRARGLLWLYVTNALGILVSAGLLIPWAVIRTARYRAEHFFVTAERGLGEFQGSRASTVRAAGAEVGEFFDFDFSL